MTVEGALFIALIYSMIISGLFIREMFEHEKLKHKYEVLRRSVGMK